MSNAQSLLHLRAALLAIGQQLDQLAPRMATIDAAVSIERAHRHLAAATVELLLARAGADPTIEHRSAPQ